MNYIEVDENVRVVVWKFDGDVVKFDVARKSMEDGKFRATNSDQLKIKNFSQRKLSWVRASLVGFLFERDIPEKFADSAIELI